MQFIQDEVNGKERWGFEIGGVPATVVDGRCHSQLFTSWPKRSVGAGSETGRGALLA